MKALALLVFVGVITAAFPSNGQTASREQAQVYTETYTEHLKIPYLIIVPKNYRPSGEKWPVLLYLHGAGERGNDLAKLKQTPAVQVAEKAKDFPFILVAAQEQDEERSWIGPAQIDGVPIFWRWSSRQPTPMRTGSIYPD